jgi:integrase
MSKDIDIHKEKVRAALKPRREPYWGARVEINRSLGYRKIDAQRGSWIARRKDEGRCSYKALGAETAGYGYDEAKKDAYKWFGDGDQGVTSEDYTVAKVCELYCEDRKRQKGEATARDAEMRFKRTVDDTALGRQLISKLRTHQIKAWFHALDLSKASANRTLIALKAALNFAATERLVTAAARQEWRDVKPYEKAGKRRSLFLDLEQRRALLENATGAVRDLIEAAMLTGARAGELVSARRSAFDARQKLITLSGKTDMRPVWLSPAAVTLFERLAKAKLPAAYLLTRDDGKPWAHSDWDELVRDAAERAELPVGVCLYTLRHSWITQAITDGMSVLTVAKLVGTSVTMIDKHYGKLAPEAREQLSKMVMA